MEFRAMSKRVPRELFPTGRVRIWLGDPQTRKERKALEQVRGTLKAIARRQDWQVLRRVKDGELTAEAVHAAVRRVGLDSYIEELKPVRRTPTISEALDEWELRNVAESTAEHYERAVRWLADHLGPETPMDDQGIGRADIRGAIERLEDRGLAENTRASYVTAWGSFFSWWQEKEEDAREKHGYAPHLTRHPVQGLKAEHKPRIRATQDRYLFPDEASAIFQVAPDDVRACYGVLLYCGLRPSEMRWLRPQDVRIPDTVEIRARKGWEPKGYTRFGSGEGSIPIHRVHLLPLLERHRDLYAGTDFFFLNPRTGQQWRELAFRKQLEADCEKAGVPYGRNTKNGVTPHVFRHTLGSWLAQKDVQLMKIAELLRDRPETVAKHYAHLLPKDLDETLHRAL